MADPTQTPVPETPQSIGPDDYRSLLKGEALGSNSQDEQFALDTMRSRDLVPHLPPLRPTDPWFGMAEDAHGIPHGLLPSISHQESGGTFDPYIVGNRGRGPDRGIMQFIPSTGAHYGITDANWTNPYLQIDRAGRLLADNYARTGTWDRAITAYNGGGDPNYLTHVNQWYRGGRTNYQGVTYEPVGTPGEPPQPGTTTGAPSGAPGAFAPATPGTPAPVPGLPWFKQPVLQPAPVGGAPAGGTTPAAVPWFKRSPAPMTPGTAVPSEGATPPAPIPGTFLGRMGEGGFDYPRSFQEVINDIAGLSNPRVMGGRTLQAVTSAEPAAAYAAAVTGAKRFGYDDERARHMGNVAWWTSVLTPLGIGAVEAAPTALNVVRAGGRRIGAAASDVGEAAFGTASRAAKRQNVAIDLANTAAKNERAVNLQQYESGIHDHFTGLADPEAQSLLDESSHTLRVARQDHLQDLRENPTLTDHRGRPLGPNQREDLINHLTEMNDPKAFTDSDLRQITRQGGQRTIGHAPDPAAAWRGPHESAYAWATMTERELSTANAEMRAARNADSLSSRVSHLENAQQAWNRAGVATPPSVQRVLDSHEGFLRYKASPVPQTPHVEIPQASRLARTAVRGAEGAAAVGGSYLVYKGLRSALGGSSPAAHVVAHAIGE